MLDFVKIKESVNGRGVMDIYPEFLVKKSKDLMIRSKSFYAVWDEEAGLWSTNEQDVQRMIDKMVFEHSEALNFPGFKRLKLLGDFSSRKWTEWKAYCQSLSDNFHDLDDKIIFANTEVKKSDYITRHLEYNLDAAETPAYDELMETIYAPEERQKLEWALGSVIAGDSKRLQKFIVIHGDPGTGKGTFLEIIEELFPGYCSKFNAKEMTNNSAFGLESLKDNNLIAIQPDGDLSRIEDNTLLNSVVSHEAIPVNEKFKSIYTMKFKSFLFMATNKPVKITDSKSGVIRRLIDVKSSGNTVPTRRYDRLRREIKFEYGGIAHRCLEVYKELSKNYYNSYVPIAMIARTNDFYIFIDDEYDYFSIEHKDGISLDAAWDHYRKYCDRANVSYPYTKKTFRYELRNYFENFEETGGPSKNWYSGFKTDIFRTKVIGSDEDGWLVFNTDQSKFDDIFSGCKAQYATRDGFPLKAWDSVQTTLEDLNTRRLHYVQTPLYLIMVDFDLKDENGEKSLELNMEAANRWPKTYAELSKSGSGIHLYYIYNGDIEDLESLYSKDIEIKVCKGNAAFRRKVTKCNDIGITTITSGLPKKEKKVISEKTIRNERKLRSLIVKNLKKEIHPNTKPSIDFINELLNQAYDNNVRYDVRDMANDILVFAKNSKHQSDYCLKVVSNMKFYNDKDIDPPKIEDDGSPMIFFDIEVYPNLFVVVWKPYHSKNSVRLVNPTPDDISKLVKMKLVGFNNRRYDNHILYARMMGYNNEQLFNLSQNIINEGVLKHGFVEAYDLSYTDVYDFLASSNKMSLKKWEIKLRIHHMEMPIPWDKPVPEELWEQVAIYCENDVVATEAVFDSKEGQSDWKARQILADISGLTVNDTTNKCTTKFIVGDDKNPQTSYIYTDLSKMFKGYEFNKFGIDKSRYKPGAKIVSGKSIYRGEDPGEGGRVFATPGIHYNVGLFDVASMHPSSIIALNLFGDIYTKRFEEIVKIRLLIKHKKYFQAKGLLGGKLAKYLDDPQQAKELANALKTAINSVYGLTSAKFSNKLKDERNIDNIVAKRGALFMIDLQKEVEKRGYTVVHVKTDSIKIANVDDDISKFVMEFGKQYGYTFEKEAVYKKMCLVNEAVYTALVVEEDGEKVKPYWTNTGDQFKVPYVFKTLFSHEPYEFYDFCETKSVSTSLYLDMNESLPDVSFVEKELKKVKKKLKDGGPNTELEQQVHDLEKKIEEGHKYEFVGRVGLFCPIKPGCGGGILLRATDDGRFSAAEGTKKKDGGVYRWLEAETVMKNHIEDFIDMSYFESLADAAVEEIEKFGSFKEYVSIGNDIFNIDVDEELPFDDMNKPA